MNEWMNEWMFNDTLAQKPIGYWVSEQGRCMIQNKHIKLFILF